MSEVRELLTVENFCLFLSVFVGLAVCVLFPVSLVQFKCFDFGAYYLILLAES